MRLHVQNIVFISLMVFFSAFGFSREFESSKLDKITVVDGVPWSIEPIDEHRFLIALRQGDLIILDGQTGAVTPVSGVPEVYASGQGGLMDVIVSPTDNDVIYFYLCQTYR